MATDYRILRQNLRSFYDFAGKTVLYVGAGGNQLFDPAIRTKKLIAIDRNVEALRELAAKAAAQHNQNGQEDSIEVIGANFAETTQHGDAVYFEFCLHEMADPEHALKHARTLTPEIVVYDHLPGSEWTFHAAEEKLVEGSARALELAGVRRRQAFVAEQRFRDYEELIAKIAGQGPLAIERAQRFRNATDIVISMAYSLALI